MKKIGRIILIVSVVIVFVLIISIFAYKKYNDWCNEIIKTELYENDYEIFTVDYQNNGSIGFSIEDKYLLSTFSAGADFINENTAVFDTKNALPEGNTYYEIKFYDGYLEFWQDGELQGTYEKTDKIHSDYSARIIVNGKDITNGAYYRYNYRRRRCEIPLLAVLQELGAEVKWKSATKVTVKYNNETVKFDTEELDFGIISPPGTTNAIRKVRGKELIFDNANAANVIKALTGATVTLDNDTYTVYIES